jgi:hypothetical protein
MALFKVNTGTREREVVSLRWQWEVTIPELGTSIFVIPHDYVKNALEREFGRPCPAGFRSIRVHDLKHTFGHRLQVAGVSFEDRKLLLGHKAQHVTTHYSAPEIGALIDAAERVYQLESLASPAISVVRSRA